MRANKKDSIATWSAVGMLVWGVILILCGSIFGIVTYAKSRLGEIEL